MSEGETPEPRVGVVVVHYNQERQLERTYRALLRQTLPPFEIVVADDGSSTLPSLSPGGIATRLVTQANLGFRAAAARNLGAAQCRSEVLVFLDADTTPEPDFLRQLTRRVALCRDVVAVGRRRHADLAALPVDVDPRAARELEEPAWLRHGYQESRNLLEADGRSFRYVISSVLACRASLYGELEGFDERFVGYGGEDWDFAYRAWNAGAVLVHEPGAVAWHDGPDWAARHEPRSNHDQQSLRLAALIPEPQTRGAPLPHRLPDLLVDLQPGLDAGAAVRCIHSLLRQSFGDLRVQVSQPDPVVADLYADAVRLTPWNPDQLARARARLVVRAPLPTNAVQAGMQLLTAEDLGVVELLSSGLAAATLTSTRAVARARRWSDRLARDQVIGDHFGRQVLEVGPPPVLGADLAQFFAQPWPSQAIRGNAPPGGCG